jgi:hypothetical protein
MFKAKKILQNLIKFKNLKKYSKFDQYLEKPEDFKKSFYDDFDSYTKEIENETDQDMIKILKNEKEKLGAFLLFMEDENAFVEKYKHIITEKQVINEMPGGNNLIEAGKNNIIIKGKVKKVFYSSVTFEKDESENFYKSKSNFKIVKFLLPYRNKFVYLKTENEDIVQIPNEICAQSLVTEWELQNEVIINEKLPLTKLFSTAFETTEDYDHLLKIKDQILKYFESDVLW